MFVLSHATLNLDFRFVTFHSSSVEHLYSIQNTEKALGPILRYTKHFLGDTVKTKVAASSVHFSCADAWGKSNLGGQSILRITVTSSGRVQSPSFSHIWTEMTKEVNFTECFIMVNYSSWVNRVREKWWNLGVRKTYYGGHIN